MAVKNVAIIAALLIGVINGVNNNENESQLGPINLRATFRVDKWKSKLNTIINDYNIKHTKRKLGSDSDDSSSEGNGIICLCLILF